MSRCERRGRAFDGPAGTMFAVPVVIFFMIVQRRMVGGLTAGAVKG